MLMQFLVVIYGGPLLENTAQIVSGEMMAGTDIFDLEFIGRGGHGAHPHTCIDPIIMTTQFVNNIQSVISRRLAPYEAGVITVGQICAGTTYNVIPTNAYLKGTVRFLNDKTQDILKSSLEEVAAATAKSNGGDYKLKYTKEFPPLINDENAALIARKAFAKVLGEENIIVSSKPDMGAEDFAFLTRERMGAYVFVGISKDLNHPALHHSSTFCWDDENLKVLMQGDVMMALEFLNL